MEGEREKAEGGREGGIGIRRDRGKVTEKGSLGMVNVMWEDRDFLNRRKENEKHERAEG